MREEALAGRFRWIARDESSHARRLSDLRDDLGGSDLIRPDLQSWVVAHYPAVMELWDLDDDDPEAAMRQADLVESASERFYQSAAKAAASGRTRALFLELAEEEAAHRAPRNGR